MHSGYQDHKKPRIDGRLDEPEWDLGKPASDFDQLELNEGAVSSESTLVFVLYEDKNLYLGFKCFDSEPEKIVANVMCRDAEPSNNDMVDILLDTFHDHRSAFSALRY